MVSLRLWFRHLSKCWSSYIEKKQEKPATTVKTGRLVTSAELKTLTENYYRDLANAKEEGRPVVWITSVTPIEVVYAFEGIPFFPENYAALCSSRKVASGFCEVAESAGYSQDLCAYALCMLGSLFAKPGRGVIGEEEPPEPDLLITTKSACQTLSKWWEALQRHFKCPLFTIDCVYPVDSETLNTHYKEYYSEQLKELVAFMENYTGRKLDMAKFREVISLSDRASQLWDEIDDLRKAVPTPMSQIDIFTCLFPLVTLRGTQEAASFYEKLRYEVKERVDQGIGFIPNERFRLIWDLFPIYHDIRITNYFAEFGAAFVTDLYGNSFSGRLDPADPFGSLAERYLNYFSRAAFLGKSELYKERARKYKVDGAVFHANRCCRYATAGQPDIGLILREELGLPYMIFEGNMVDPRGYDGMQVRTYIESFIEMLEAQKYPDGSKRTHNEEQKQKKFNIK